MPRRFRFAAACIALAGGAGCTSYEERPLDLPGYEQVFAARPHLAARRGAIVLEDGISRDEGEVLALLFDADLRRQRAAAVGALDLAEHTGTWADPELGFELGGIKQNIEHRTYTDVRVGFQLPLSGRLAAAEAAAKAGAEVELARVLAAEWHARTSLCERWCAWSAAIERLETQRELVSVIAARLERLLEPRRRGEIDAVEVGTWELLLVERRLQISALEREVASLAGELRERMGLVPEADLELVPDASAPELPAASERRVLLEERNADLAVERALYEQRERELETEIRAQYPDLRLGPIHQSDTGLDRWLLGLWFPLPLWNRNAGAIATASGAREQARASFEGRWERVRHALRRAELELDGARADRSLVESEWLPRLEEQAGRLRARADRGALDPLLELQLAVDHCSARLRAIDLRQSEAQAAHRLRALLGPKPAPKALEKEEP